MNLTDWMFSKYIKLENASSAETYHIISEAKKRTENIRAMLSGGIIGLFLWMAIKLGEPLNLEIFNGLDGWALVLIWLISARCFSKLIEDVIIKRSITSLIKDDV